APPAHPLPLHDALPICRALEDLGFEQRLMQELESKGALDRAVEFLPDDKALAERARNEQPLTRPEIAVLLAYAKLTLSDALLSRSEEHTSELQSRENLV